MKSSRFSTTANGRSVHSIEALRPFFGAVDFNGPKVGLEKAEIQKKTVERACRILEHQPVVLLADEVGMGKTFEALGILFVKALGYLNGRKGVPRILILVPSIALRKKWIDDLEWFSEHCIVGIGPKIEEIRNAFFHPFEFRSVAEYVGKNLGSRYRLAIATVNTVVGSLHYEGGPRHRKWDIIVIDEAHKFRNPFSRRSQLFTVSGCSKSEENHPLFQNRFDKLVLMSATPFQLEVEEVCNLLRLGHGARTLRTERGNEYKKQIDDLEGRLHRYKEAEANFEDAWSSLPKDQVSDVEAAINGTGATPTSSQVAEMTSFYRQVKQVADELRGSLREQVIRNRKSDDESGYRKIISGSMREESSDDGVEITPDEELFYLHINKFVHDTAGKLFSVQVLQETTSSYETLKKYQKHNGWDRAALISPSLETESKRIKSAIDAIIRSSAKGGSHPKQKELLELLGLSDNKYSSSHDYRNKLLIFCRFVETANWLRDSINDCFQQLVTDNISQNVRRTLISRPGSRRRFTSRYEDLLKRERDTLLEGFVSSYQDLKHIQSLVTEEAKFVRQAKGKRRVRTFWKSIRDEFFDVLISKLKEDYILFDIMKDLDEGASNAITNDRQKSYLISGSVAKVFANLLGEIRPELQTIEREFERSGRKDQAIDKLVRLINGLRRERFAASLTGETKDIVQSRIMDSFNTPFNPRVLIVTQVGEEGVDLQKQCSRVLHYDLWWNPAVMEQRVGRVDRIGSKIEADLKKYKIADSMLSSSGEPKLYVFEPFIRRSIDEDIFNRLQSRKKWFKLIIGKRFSEDKKLDVNKLLVEASVTPLTDSIAESLMIDLSA